MVKTYSFRHNVGCTVRGCRPTPSACKKRGSSVEHGGKTLQRACRRVCKRPDNIILYQWVVAHQTDPYPSNSEKVILARMSRKTLTQLNQWFANNRRAIKKTSMEDWIQKHPVPPLPSHDIFKKASIGKFKYEISGTYKH